MAIADRTFSCIENAGRTAELYLGDCKEVLQLLQDNTVDLIVTSPPYADQRKTTYGGISPDRHAKG